jgi:hypothetical protein
VSSTNDHRPSFVLTRLYRKKSEKGATYFVGRLGGARVALLKSNDVADDGAEIWNLLMSEAPAKRDAAAGQRTQEPSNGDRRQPAAGAQQRDWQRPADDDPIPF